MSTKRFSWLQAQWWPIILITGGTLVSTGVYFKRHWQNDPEIVKVPRGALAGVDVAGGSEKKTEGYGRKTAVASGLMDGDRGTQGIFPNKRIAERLKPYVAPCNSDEE